MCYSKEIVLFFLLLDPYIPYTVEVAARTIVGEGPTVTNVVFTEHGGEDMSC